MDDDMQHTNPPPTRGVQAWGPALALLTGASVVALVAWRHVVTRPVLELLVASVLCAGGAVLLRRLYLLRGAHALALREVEERHRVEAALRVSEARYRAVFDSATDGMLVLDERGGILEANPAAGAIEGIDAREMIGHAVERFLAPDTQHQYNDFRRQLARDGAALIRAVDQREDGRRVYLEVRGSYLKQLDKPRVLVVITDVTEHKEALKRQAMLSRKVLRAQEEERARLARELHDELGQILTAVRLEVGMLRRHLNAGNEQAGDFVARAVDLVQKGTDELRRICRALRPPLLDDLGLEPAVRLLIEQFIEQAERHAEVDIDLDDAPQQVPPELALCTYRVLQEALTNIRRHAQAERVRVSLQVVEGVLRLCAEDDGVGFEASDPDVLRGFGLAGMRERANLVGGKVTIDSTCGEGTRVVFRAPLAKSLWPVSQVRRNDDQSSRSR
jgi:PAS domain S-box-containing protein